MDSNILVMLARVGKDLSNKNKEDKNPRRKSSKERGDQKGKTNF